MSAIGRQPRSGGNEEVRVPAGGDLLRSDESPEPHDDENRGSSASKDLLFSDRDFARVVVQVRRWRRAVAGEWSPAELTIELGGLRDLFTMWQAFGLDPGALLHVILGTEWLFRARRTTDEDVERELAKLESNLAKPLRPLLEPYQAAILVSALAGPIAQRMKDERYLVCLGCWTRPARNAT